MKTFVAFIRNINVGQTRFPNRTQLELAFLASGAHSAVSFQSNGTVIIDLDQSINLSLFKDGISEYLRLHCNFSDALFIRDLESIKRVVHQNPYSAINYEGYTHQYVSYYEYPGMVKGIFPLESPKKDCYVFSGSDGEAYSIAKDIHGISGYPTPLLEKTLITSVTTRSWATIMRLTARN